MGPADQLAALSRGNTAFALELYARLGHGDGNRFFSPLSISAALAMTYAGARDDTARQMARALHFDLPAQELHAAFHGLIAELRGRTSGPLGADEKEAPAVQLLLANALWHQAGTEVLQPFRELIEADYRGGLFPVDFRGAAEPARRTINAWVEEQTRGKIKNLLEPNNVGASTILVLTNAIYFRALWSAPFSVRNTRPAEFHVSAAEAVQVDMMNQTGRFRYLDAGSFQALELPYKGNALGMVIFLPEAADGLAAWESTASPEKLASALAKLAPRRVQVNVPRFRLTGEFSLNDALSDLGMPSAFELGVANFEGMTGRRDIAISAVVHKAFVEVEEEGTEAAAATGVTMSRTATIATPSPIFRADHPFFFLIRDLENGSILFLGRLVRPGA